MTNGINVKEIMESDMIEDRTMELPEAPYRSLIKTRNPSAREAKIRADSIYSMIKMVVDISQDLEEANADEMTKNEYYILYRDLIGLYQKEINTSLDNIVDESMNVTKRTYPVY